MFPLFETIAIEHGRVGNLSAHQQRYEQSLRTYYAPLFTACSQSYAQPTIFAKPLFIEESAVKIYDLSQLIHIPTALAETQGAPLIRCRIDYNHCAYQIRYFPYERKNYRTFQLVYCDEIDYGLKYADRQQLNQLFEQRNGCDEIMIIKQGFVTDCSIGNLIFRKGNQWVTPIKPLLPGTQRAKLLAQGKIQLADILATEVVRFDEIRVINALNGL